MTAHPKLLTLTPDFPPSLGGIQVYLHRLLQNLPTWQHHVVARSASGVPLDDVPVTRTRLGSGPWSILELNARCAAAGARTRPDIVLCAHVVCAPAAATLSRLMGVPVVFIAFADELTHRPRLTRLACRTASATVAISRYTAGLVSTGAPRGPVHMVPPGFDAPTIVRRPDARPTIVTVARLTDRYKGHDLMIDALGSVQRLVPDVQWLVAGDGPLRGELEARVAKAGLDDAVKFLGRVTDEERDALLGRAWVFAMPSRLPDRGAGGEGFGIVYLEAASAGVPVLAGNVAGALDAVAHDESGLLVDPTNPDAIADGLVRLLTDHRLIERIRAAGPPWAARFGWSRMGNEIDMVLRTALESDR